jgi:hypothetical protein
MMMAFIKQTKSEGVKVETDEYHRAIAKSLNKEEKKALAELEAEEIKSILKDK